MPTRFRKTTKVKSRKPKARSTRLPGGILRLRVLSSPCPKPDPKAKVRVNRVPQTYSVEHWPSRTHHSTDLHVVPVDFGFTKGFVDQGHIAYYYSYEGYDSRAFFHLGLPNYPRQRVPYLSYNDLENAHNAKCPSPQKFLSLAFHTGRYDPYGFMYNAPASVHLNVFRYIFSLIHLRKIFGVYNG